MFLTPPFSLIIQDFNLCAYIMATNPGYPLPDQSAFSPKKRNQPESESGGDDNSLKKRGKSVLFPPLSPSDESSRGTIGIEPESFTVMTKGIFGTTMPTNKSFNLIDTISFVLQFFIKNRVSDNELDTSDDYNKLVTKRIDDLTHLAVLYYSGCKHHIPELTYLDFAVAFVIYYLSTKNDTFNNADIIDIYGNKPTSNKVGDIIEGGANPQRVNSCSFCLTSFDAPDSSLTDKLYVILGGKRKIRRNNRTSKNKKSKKNRKNRKGKSKSKRRRSRRLISH